MTNDDDNDIMRTSNEEKQPTGRLRWKAGCRNYLMSACVILFADESRSVNSIFEVERNI